MRLIDADALNDLISRRQAIDTIMELIEARQGWLSDASREINALDAAYCAIEDLPTIDAVPVIRCKDCKWYIEEDCLRENVVETGVYYQSIIEYPLPDDFCSRAKRREKE